MNPLVPQTAGLMAVQEGIKAVSNMVSEIEIFLKKYLTSIGFFIGVTKNDYI